MKPKKLLLLILSMLMLSSCWLYHGDPPREPESTESAYYAFVNETEHEIWIDCYEDSYSNIGTPHKVSWRIRIPSGEETSILCREMYLGNHYTVFNHWQSFEKIYVWKNYRFVSVTERNEKPLVMKSSYEKSNVYDGKADFKYTYRFTDEYFENATKGIPGDLEDPNSVVGGDAN